MLYEIFLQALWIIIPAYIANASAVFVGSGTPIDFGKTWRDGRRLLGDGKTWQGLLFGTFIGMISGFVLVVAASYINTTKFSSLNLTNFYGFPLMIPLIFSICFGALLGDIIESFFKRRLGKERGEDLIPFDQIDFILGVLFFSFFMSSILHWTGLSDTNWFIINLYPWHILVLLVITPFFHLSANYLHKIQRNAKK
ncbi:MAG: CDP-2,3-bis-(O-geranylgeranyl)-sn-glycerol synthase [Thermoplasmatota archaeon]